MANEKLSCRDIEQSIEEDRRRIDEKLTAIQERLTPGQLIDEAIGFIKAKGGGEYFTNLGHAAKENPLPMAMMGVSLAWLMVTGNKTRSGTPPQSSEVEYPIATVTGSMRRTGPPVLEDESRYSYFVDGAGKRFKALTDDAGRRAGHFMDDAGQMFRGFADSTGSHIHDIRDEAGSIFDAASGWASSTWRAATEAAGSLGSSVSETGRNITQKSSDAMRNMPHQAARLNETIMSAFRDQPLVGGALAFAVGAALGATLPHTRREDEVLGSSADKARARLSETAEEMMEQGREFAGDVYNRASNVAQNIQEAARKSVKSEAKDFAPMGDAGSGSRATH